MKLLPIKKDQFPQWKKMREAVYSSLGNEFHDQEMKQVLVSEDWFSYFLINEKNQQVGFVELSSRNIVDGCLSSPVAYLEGIYLKKEYRRQGLGRGGHRSYKNLEQTKRLYRISNGYRTNQFISPKIFQSDWIAGKLPNSSVSYGH